MRTKLKWSFDTVSSKAGRRLPPRNSQCETSSQRRLRTDIAAILKTRRCWLDHSIQLSLSGMSGRWLLVGYMAHCLTSLTGQASTQNGKTGKQNVAHEA